MRYAVAKALAYAIALSSLLLFAALPAKAEDKIAGQEAHVDRDAARIFESNNAGCALGLAALRPSPTISAAQPNWLGNNVCLLRALIVAIQDGRFPDKFQYEDGVGSQPAKLQIQLDGDFEETGHDPISIPLATYPCMIYDFRAKVAGSWGSKCRVLRIVKPLNRVSGIPVSFPGAEKMYQFSWTRPGKQSIRFIVENGAGKQIDCTLIFKIRQVNDKD